MSLTAGSRSIGSILHKKAEVKSDLSEYMKINFNHRKDLADYGDLVEMLFPGNRNQQHAAACIFFELKWADGLVPNLSYLEKRYDISRRILQRSRAKLSRLGIIEHISSFNKRYNGQAGWKLSTRFERGLNQLAKKHADFKDTITSSEDKDRIILSYTDAQRYTEKENLFRLDYRKVTKFIHCKTGQNKHNNA